MKNLYIIGAGGCGREVLQWIKDINKKENRWNIKGFLDDDLHALDTLSCDYTVVASIKDFQISENDEFICGIGNGNVREKIITQMTEKGAVFTKVIHPTAIVADSAVLGKAVVLYPYSIVSDNAIVGEAGIVNMYSSVAHDSVLGSYCTISAHCDITGKCIVGNQVFMGTSSKMVPGTRIGDHVYICAGSTVMASIKSNRKVLGNPAKIINL